MADKTTGMIFTTKIILPRDPRSKESLQANGLCYLLVGGVR
jgi:hypothetical protein